ncbi:MAG: DUF2073 domain-containing protein [Methanosarcinaceae archaeon]|jgi:hypothetical protein|nr:DUF2073 domain-containing protein [Methanosarcinaceae archaeon]
MQSIQMNIISKDKMARMASVEKVRFIIDEVKSGKILILEQGLSPKEEADLIEMTMMSIEPGVFSGIEIESHISEEKSSFISKLFKKKSPPKRLTVIGPADQLKTIGKDRDMIRALVSSH